MIILMHGPKMVLMHHVKMAVNRLFIVKDFAAFRTHVSAFFLGAFISACFAKRDSPPN